MIKDISVDEIKRTLKKYKSELKEKFGVKEIGVFGSYVRREQKKGSDIDILVEFHPDTEMDLIKFVELEEYLSKLLGIKVDLVMKSALKPRIGKRILKEVVYI
ncbi:MAG: nucleotidyltransferase [Candidatus Syntrophoarchaeum caldarius]|uniref:protein adenylyltransferase n=1 Tax=Candidatus Syntropharchaeum caldarium TaxID=1838285 RepID=A0A1F2PA87_9EURY|nr:MAG: nucleotidyltransferase [Candidatus Syntrophoarchaeum caldarius]